MSRPGCSVGNLETFWRWDTSSNLGSHTNWDFLSHHAQQVENDYVVETQNRLHGQRGKGTAESFSR